MVDHPETASVSEETLLRRITTDSAIFGGKPIIRGHRLAVEQVLGMLAGGDSPETILAGYPFLESQDIRACLVYARRLVSRERVEPALETADARIIIPVRSAPGNVTRRTVEI